MSSRMAVGARFAHCHDEPHGAEVFAEGFSPHDDTPDVASDAPEHCGALAFDEINGFVHSPVHGENRRKTGR